jgi:TonB family protein
MNIPPVQTDIAKLLETETASFDWPRYGPSTDRIMLLLFATLIAFSSVLDAQEPDLFWRARGLQAYGRLDSLRNEFAQWDRMRFEYVVEGAYALFAQPDYSGIKKGKATTVYHLMFNLNDNDNAFTDIGFVYDNETEKVIGLGVNALENGVSAMTSVENSNLTLAMTDSTTLPSIVLSPFHPWSTKLVYSSETIELEPETNLADPFWDVDKPPVPTKRVVPQYPDEARKGNITGRVYVTALVGKHGKVEQIGEITGPAIFQEAAKAAALKWEFEPASQEHGLGRKTVECWVSLPFTFKLNN